jgi:hypothetical protein
MVSELATDLIGWLNNHGKVRIMFNEAQAEISKNSTGKAKVLTYLVANLTRWTTHCIAFIWLLHVQNALKLKVIQNCEGMHKSELPPMPKGSPHSRCH